MHNIFFCWRNRGKDTLFLVIGRSHNCTMRSATFRGSTVPVLTYLPPVPRASTRGTANPALRYACTGLIKYHPSGVNDSVRSIWKYGAGPKSHAALRFLPLRNCVVLSVKKRELSEATRNGMQCCKFSRFSEKRPILGKNRAAAKRISFRLFSLGASKENRQT